MKHAAFVATLIALALLLWQVPSLIRYVELHARAGADVVQAIGTVSGYQARLDAAIEAGSK